MPEYPPTSDGSELALFGTPELVCRQRISLHGFPEAFFPFRSACVACLVFFGDIPTIL